MKFFGFLAISIIVPISIVTLNSKYSAMSHNGGGHQESASKSTQSVPNSTNSKPQNLKGKSPAQDWALERARQEVKMLDDMYKTAIVLITEHYVNSEDDLPAGEAFKLLFALVEEKGWHKVRLIDASGEPLNDENEPEKGFETKAVKQILSGMASYDEIVEEDGKRFLRTATAIPVVMDKCIMCHENYKGLPEGKAIGAIGYRVPIHDIPKTILKASNDLE